ncbi:MAG: RNA polymerase sigma factor [Sandaracinaceae bacterium]|nr:RNA polymerase sigma factor [Sandaracinaceae bacterium]
MALQAQSEERAELGRLLREHSQAIAYLCRSIVGESHARDATQESFERIVRNVGSFDGGRGPFRTWAFAVSRNVCRDMLRRRGVESGVMLEVDEAHLDVAHVGSLPDEALAQKLDMHALERALETLPEPMRTALVLFHMHDASYEEIAQMLNVPMGTVMTWLHRGRARLKARLETV